MRVFFIIIIILSLFTNTYSQVVNIEKKRINNKEKGMQGSIDLSIGFIKSESDIIQGKNSLKLQYNNNNSTFLFFNNISLIKADDKNFMNDGFQHLRYNYNISNSLVIAEFFVQHQYNTIKNLKKRFLTGAGPRIRISENDTIRFYTGYLCMYEYELLTDDTTQNQSFRLSAYISLGYNFNKNFSINHITYYQPVFIDFQDYRISSETYFSFKFATKLSFKLVYTLTYDTNPPLGINKLFYSLNNTISYSF
ncbi:MAG: DUF481 domain-containing protein [Bacteroidales bacterium]|nr:DUF481 domain-containing protein [Bacteroidales bacterium]